MRKSKKQGGDAVLKFSEYKRKRVDELETNLDALFQLPLAEFTGARNALAARLKKSGREDEKAAVARVKALAKPPVSAWAVNQLYWNHREALDRLIASGERFHKAQTSRQAGKAADMRSALDARREALTHLTDLATALLRDADPNPGQNPSLDIIRRITSTLEAISAMSGASHSDAPRPGRLTHDVDPPGFESFASFVPAATKPEAGGKRQSAGERQEAGRRRQAAGTTELETPKSIRFTHKASSATTNTQRKIATQDDVRRVEEAHKSKIAGAKVSLQAAKRTLTQARARAQSLETAQKKADAEAKKIEKHRRDVEASLEKAKAASEDAARRARNVAAEMEEATRAVEDADRIVEKAAKELESLVRESSGR